MDYADEVDADVIVMGEKGDHAEHFSGVQRRVSDAADCEVILVHANVKPTGNG